MSNDKSSESGQLSCQIQAIASVVHDAAKSCQGDTIAILSLLRQLEKLHREIRDGAFQESLPSNRRQLYSLLKDIESEGGWPYIERMRIQAFLANFQEDSTEENSDEVLTSDRSCDF
ncbi:hypothetical protein WKK05_33135 [Nostoc sp. UHCC 0302]|uniref:hypothetical protein n=1 Tax=Nostoc sp. UHCC 0302 TaxID=3134896 RepID=UPI00311CA6FB